MLLGDGKPLDEALWLYAEQDIGLSPGVIEYVSASGRRATIRRRRNHAAIGALVVFLAAALVALIIALAARRSVSSCARKA